jgi:DNA-binding transcriptional MocR family regulator
VSDVQLRLIRQVGPTAWAVLELIRERSESDGGAAFAPVTIRNLAVELGLAKNTVQRAIQRLRAAGLIEPRQARTDAGTFATGRYELIGEHIERDCAIACHVEHPMPTNATTTSASDGQLTLGI